MDRKAISESLRALTFDDMNRSKAARLRDVIDDVEATLAAGVPRSLVVKELAAHGLDMTLTTFETTLKRIRQKRGQPSTTPIMSVRQSPGSQTKTREATPVVNAETEPNSPITGSHDPADLDKIFRSKVDMDALAKYAKGMRQSKS